MPNGPLQVFSKFIRKGIPATGSSTSDRPWAPDAIYVAATGPPRIGSPRAPRPDHRYPPGSEAGNTKAAVSSGFVRLRGRDSNPDYLIQSQASYH